ncbi:MAG: hypothetical protein ACYC27_10315 [Armatimonadota bacterium]
MVDNNCILSNEDLLRKILPHLRIVKGPDYRGEYTAWCCFHKDGEGKIPHQANLMVSVRGFICHACVRKGSLQKLAKHLGIIGISSMQEPESIYDYYDESRELVYQAVRYPGKKFTLRRPDGKGGFIYNLNGISRILYKLPEIISRPDDPVIIVEGEKDVDNLIRHGLLATTNPMGAGKWNDSYNQYLIGRDVVIIPDNDMSGMKHAESIALSLQGVAGSIKIVKLPDLPEKGDVSDWLACGNTVDQLLNLIKLTPSFEVDNRNENVLDEKKTLKNKSQAKLILDLIFNTSAELFHNQNHEPYARVPVSNHYELMRCNGSEFKRWVGKLFWEQYGTGMNKDAFKSALDVFESKARYDGQKYHLHNRVAWYNDCIWYDLTDDEWRVVRIGPNGWDVVDNPPILFERYSHQCAQVIPERGGKLQDIADLVNLYDDQQAILLMVYIVSCLIPDIPHPIFIAHGPAGAAKTTFSKLIRKLVDPSRTAVLSFPQDYNGIVQLLSHNWMAMFDNLTSIPQQVSDLLCRAVTGDGFSKRALYTDDDDVIFSFQRCIGINGINVIMGKPDLLDHAIVFGLNEISESDRKLESELWKAFDSKKPFLLGAMFDALSGAMSILPQIHLDRLPRMADFTYWGCAVACALGISQHDFLHAYTENRSARNNEVLDANPVAAIIMLLMEDKNEWKGTASELLYEMNDLANNHQVDVRDKNWPKSSHKLTPRIKEVLTNLSAAGIRVEFSRHSKQRLITLQKFSESIVAAVTDVIKQPTDRVSLPYHNDASYDDGSEQTGETSWDFELNEISYDDNDNNDDIESLLLQAEQSIEDENHLNKHRR